MAIFWPIGLFLILIVLLLEERNFYAYLSREEATNQGLNEKEIQAKPT